MMGDINIDQLIEILPKLIRENDRVKGAIISALAGVVATKEDIALLIQEMDKRFDATERRFETMQAEIDRRFDATERRFETMQAEMNKRFETMQAEMNKRFETMQAEMDKRFDAMDRRFETAQSETNKRFESAQSETNKRFDHVMNALNSIQAQIGKPFEQFARNVVIRILEGEGFSNVKLKAIEFPDPEYFVHKESNRIELDGYSENPPILVEITSVLRDKYKVEKFLRKKEFFDRQQQKTFRGFFIAAGCELDQETKAELIVALKNNNCELINL
jgi:hypothetical protein